MSVLNATPLPRRFDGPDYKIAQSFYETPERSACPRAPITAMKTQLPSFRELEGSIRSKSPSSLADIESSSPATSQAEQTALPSAIYRRSEHLTSKSEYGDFTEEVKMHSPRRRRVTEGGSRRNSPEPSHSLAPTNEGISSRQPWQDSASRSTPGRSGHQWTAYSHNTAGSRPAMIHSRSDQHSLKYPPAGKSEDRIPTPRRQSDESVLGDQYSRLQVRHNHTQGDGYHLDRHPQQPRQQLDHHVPRVPISVSTHGGGSLPESPRQGRGSHSTSMPTAMSPGAQRIRAMSTNDRPLSRLPLGTSSLPLSAPVHAGLGNDGRDRNRRFPAQERPSDHLQAMTDTKDAFYPSPQRYHRAEGRERTPEYQYIRGHDRHSPTYAFARPNGGRHQPNPDDPPVSLNSHQGPSHRPRDHRFHPYMSDPRKSFTTYQQADRLPSSSTTSPLLSTGSSPPSKTLAVHRYRGDQYDDRGHRGLVTDEFVSYNASRHPADYHMAPIGIESSPPNMKRTRNGYKYSCGIAGPECHMPGCPVAEITQEYEYLKTIPEKDRWRPLVIPLGNRNHPQHVADYLKRWRLSHYDEPYLTKELSEHLRICLGLREEKQMSDWMTNARRRY
ncbi:unnamed protein product [Sympodiomycopsis kandeliae]